MNKSIAIASVLMAAALSGIFSTSAYATDDGDYSGTNTEQSIAQKNVGSGESTNNNCGVNTIDARLAIDLTTAAPPPNVGTVACPVLSGLVK